MAANVLHDSRVHLIAPLPFLDPLFARPALIVESDDPLGGRQVGDDETNARIKLAGMPFDLGDHPARLGPASRLVATIFADDIGFMKVEDFHRMFDNLFFDPIDGVLRKLKERIEQIGNDVLSMTAGDFKDAFGDVVLIRRDPTKLSRRWFEWKGRRQYLGRGVVFEPGGPLEISNDMLNLWRGFGIAPKSGDWSLMRAHIFNVVCLGNQELFEYLINWMAYALQHPDKPIGVAVAFLGPQGAGKGVVARTFGSFFGKHFVHITHGDQLTGRFNASLGTSCAVFLDEALWAGDKKGEGTLKALITEPTFQMEAKFRDPIMVENRLNGCV